MAAPTASNGVQRALEEIAAPSIVVFLLIIGVREFYGASEAGLLYLLLTGGILFMIYNAANYWNIPYTIGFVLAGLTLWVGVPSITPLLIPPVFTNLAQLLVLIFLIAIGMRVPDKW